MSKKGPQQPASNIFVQAIAENIKIDAVHVNLTQECIMITEDKAFRCLNEWKSRLEHGRAWIAPVSLFAPLVLTFGTTTFKDAFGFSKDSWQAVFLIGVLAAGVWSLFGIYQSVASRKYHTVEDLIEQLKKGAIVQRTVTPVQSQVFDGSGQSQISN